MTNIHDFFDEYAQALVQTAHRRLAAAYQLPCTFMDDAATMIVSEEGKLDSMLIAAQQFYKHQGITAARPDLRSRRDWTGNLVKVKIHWQFYLADNTPAYSCDNNYVLRRGADRHWRIQVAVSINEKDNIAEWISSRNKQDTL